MGEPSLSFGPVVWQKPNGELEARCYAGGVMCTFLTLGQTCTHVRPARAVENVPATPEWCEMRADAIRDAAALASPCQPQHPDDERHPDEAGAEQPG